MINLEFSLLDSSGLPVVDRDQSVGLFTGTSQTTTGLSTRFVRDGNGDFLSQTGSSLIRSKVEQVLGTLAYGAAGKGELQWRPEFGSSISALRFSNLTDSLPNVVASYVRSALTRYVPEVQLNQVGVKADKDAKLLTVKVVYTELESKATIAATISVG